MKNNNCAIVYSLLKIPGVGPSKVLEFIASKRFKSEEIQKNPLQIRKMIQDKRYVDEDIDWLGLRTKSQEVIQRNLRAGIKCTCALDEDFPQKLLEGTNPCVFFFYRGNIEILKNSKFVGVIGSRMLFDSKKNVLKYSKEFSDKILLNTKKISTILSNLGYTVVSGLALGCDTMGHEGSLGSDNKSNIAVLCGGLDSIYPSENRALANEILTNNGLLISEDSIGTPFSKQGFILRDRIQAMLSDFLVVGYTDYESGTIYACSECIKRNKYVILSTESKFDREGICKNKIVPEKYLNRYE
jgi:DNA processing protein